MSAEKMIINEFSLALPDASLQVVRITDNWLVEIGGTINGVHGSEEAICISALARNVDHPLLLEELTEAVVDEREQTKELALPNPIFELPDLDEAVLCALGRLMYNPDSAFNKSILLLGSTEDKRFTLFANMQDEGYGIKQIENFFLINSDLKALERAYKGKFETEFNRIHGFSQSDNTPE